MPGTVDVITPELPWDLQNAAVVTPVARPAVSWPTPAIHLAYGETTASIGQGVVGEAPCVALVEVGADQLLDPIDIVPVVPVAPAPQRGWVWWCAGAALAVGNMIDLFFGITNLAFTNTKKTQEGAVIMVCKAYSLGGIAVKLICFQNCLVRCL